MSSRSLFVILNMLGGAAVLGSYYWGFVSYPALRTDFWGGVPEGLRGVYTINMFFAATGYIAAFSFFMVQRSAQQFRPLLVPYTLVLIPSAMWLPLTVAVLLHPSVWLWWVIRVDLFAVGLGGILIMLRVLKTSDANNTARILTAVAMAFFILQTAILDALIWPAYFTLPGTV